MSCGMLVFPRRAVVSSAQVRVRMSPTHTCFALLSSWWMKSACIIIMIAFAPRSAAFALQLCLQLT